MKVEQRAERAGLGSDGAGVVVGAKEKAKAELWRKTQDRFNEIGKQENL